MSEKRGNHIIHIGYPKTGTTWFQRELFPKVENGIVVDKTAIKRDIISPSSFFYNSSVFWTSQFKQSRLLVSDENLIGSLQDGGLQQLHTKEMILRLKTLFPEGEVVLFLRNQTSLIASAYMEYIKMGGNHSVRNFLFDKSYSYTASRTLFSFDFLNFHDLITYCYQVFGRQKVHIYLYEEFNDNPLTFIQQFVVKHNLKVETQSLNFRKLNVRYGRFMLYFSRFMNCFTKRPLVNKYYLVHIPFWHGFSTILRTRVFSLLYRNKGITDEQILGKKTINYIKEFYQESNKRLAKQEDLQEEFKRYNYL